MRCGQGGGGREEEEDARRKGSDASSSSVGSDCEGCGGGVEGEELDYQEELETALEQVWCGVCVVVCSSVCCWASETSKSSGLRCNS